MHQIGTKEIYWCEGSRPGWVSSAGKEVAPEEWEKDSGLKTKIWP